LGDNLRLRAGMLRRDGFRRADMLLEAQICFNTPVNAATSAIARCSGAPKTAC
jgi:hypothetical protein